MRFLKKIGFLCAIAAALFFISYEKPVAALDISSERDAPLYNNEGLHALAFIQPQAEHHVVSENKTIGVFHAKWFNDTFSLNTGFSNLKPVQKFLLQDANRCESVSLLIFPFHFFWWLLNNF